MEKILTIVIPTYNMQDYLRRCLDSLIVPEEQMKQLEVLVINDGSKDNSSAIAHEYQDMYPDTFRVIDKENGNYGSCVNRGLKEATGKYIKILDADDWFDTDGLYKLVVNLFHVDVDVVFTNYDIISQTENEKIKRYRFEKLAQDAMCELDDAGNFDKINGFQMHSVTYRVQMLREMNYRQTEGISYTDQEWIYYPMFVAKTMCYFDLNVYHYMVGREGQTMDPKILVKSIPHTLAGTKSMILYYSEYDKSGLRKGRLKYLECRCLGRLRYLYKFYLRNSVAAEDLLTLGELDKFVVECSKKLYYKLFPVIYILYWRLFHARF